MGVTVVQWRYSKIYLCVKKAVVDIISFTLSRIYKQMCWHDYFQKAWSPCIHILCILSHTVYPKKHAHGFVVLCFVVVMQSFITNSHEVFIHIHQGCFAGTGAIVRLPQCQWSKPDGYGKISQCITTTKHCKAKTVCIFRGIYCIYNASVSLFQKVHLQTLAQRCIVTPYVVIDVGQHWFR